MGGVSHVGPLYPASHSQAPWKQVPWGPQDTPAQGSLEEDSTCGHGEKKETGVRVGEGGGM